MKNNGDVGSICPSANNDNPEEIVDSFGNATTNSWPRSETRSVDANCVAIVDRDNIMTSRDNQEPEKIFRCFRRWRGFIGSARAVEINAADSRGTPRDSAAIDAIIRVA